MLEAEMAARQQGPVSIGSNQGEDPFVFSPQMIAELDLLTFAAKVLSVVSRSQPDPSDWRRGEAGDRYCTQRRVSG